jgi:hypothetical protein
MNFVLLASMLFAASEPSVKSGLDVDQRPGPYSSLVVVGQERGTQHCFICEAEDRPVLIVFARTPSEPLGKLVHRLDGLLAKHVELRGWTTFLAADAGPLSPKVVEWSRQHSTGKVPVTIFEDEIGPPAYRLAKDADVTVLLSVKRKVVANFAFRAGELDAAAIERIVEAVPKITATK